MRLAVRCLSGKNSTMMRSSVSIIHAALVGTFLFSTMFVSNFCSVIDVQRTAWTLLCTRIQQGERATVHIGLRLPSPDPLVAEFVLAVPEDRPDARFERVPSSGTVAVDWRPTSGAPLPWRAVALDRTG